MFLLDNNEFNRDGDFSASGDAEKNINEESINIELGGQVDASAEDSSPVSENGNEKKEFNLFREIKDWVVSILIAVVVVFCLKSFVFELVRVDGISMMPTLEHGQNLVLTKIGYKPERGDIIVLDANYKKRQYVAEAMSSDLEKFRLNYDYFYQKKKNLEPVRYIKRVIGLPGDKIFIDNNGSVFVNDELLEENYIQGTTQPLYMEHNPYTVEDNRVFVMGDNREHSADSRSPMVGTIPYKAILGKASIRVFPLNKFGSPYKN